jgi:hypothetical protein
MTLVIISLVLLFQALLKLAGEDEVEGNGVDGGGHPEGAVNSEIAGIVSKDVMGPEGPTTT